MPYRGGRIESSLTPFSVPLAYADQSENFKATPVRKPRLLFFWIRETLAIGKLLEASVNPAGEKVKNTMSMKLYVGNLAFETSSNDLQTLFAQAGTVESVSLIEDRETGRSRGFGFVEMSTKEEGNAAVAQFNGKDVGGRTLKVNEAKPRENRSGGNGGSRY